MNMAKIPVQYSPGGRFTGGVPRGANMRRGNSQHAG